MLLELGGKAPLLVLDDADLDAAVDAAAFGAFANQGQICMSTERIVVDEQVADEFVDKLRRQGQVLPAGDPREGKAVLGSLVDRSRAERVNALVDDAVAKGAKLLAGGSGNGTLMQRARARPRHAGDAHLPRGIFGPVVGDGARARATTRRCASPTTREYGLSAAVFGRDVDARACAWRGASSRASATSTGRPCTTRRRCRSAASRTRGYGRFGGKAAIDEFTELRWITIQTAPRHYPF